MASRKILSVEKEKHKEKKQRGKSEGRKEGRRREENESILELVYFFLKEKKDAFEVLKLL